MLLTAVASAALLGQSTATIKDYVQTTFEDAHFFAKVGNANFAELKKINTDFSQSYRFKSSEVWLKEPFKLKMESTVEDVKITFLVNGTKKSTRIPDRKINISEDVAKKPGKRQTIFDFGMLSPALLRDMFEAKFIRMDRASGDVVFDLTYYEHLEDSSRHRVWIDPKMKIITKREWYGQLKRAGGRLMATFVYEQPKQLSGVWVATKASVFNADNKFAGAIAYEQMSVNKGIADSIFK